MLESFGRQAISFAADAFRRAWQAFAREHLGIDAWRASLGAWAALSIGLALTLFSWYAATADADYSKRQRFEQTIERMTRDLEQRGEDYRQLLAGARALIVSSREVEPNQWRAYVAALHLDERYPDVRALGFAPRVSSGERAAHVRAIRARGFPQYDVAPAAERSEYFPITLVEPLDARSVQSLGYDLAGDSNRRVALERARDTGRVALASHLAGSPSSAAEPSFGFLTLLPVYRGGATPATIDERRARLDGFVYLAVPPAEFVRRAAQARNPDLLLQIFDGADRASPLYETPRADADRRDAFNAVAERAFRIGGKIWTLRAAGRLDADLALFGFRPAWILAGGVAASVMLFAIAGALARARYRALARAATLAAALAESQKRFEALAGRAHDGVVSIDVDGRVVYFNDAAERMFGCPREKIMHRPVAPLMPTLPELDAARDLKRFVAGEVAGSSTAVEHLGRRVDATAFPIQPSIFVWRIDDASFVTVIVHSRVAAERKGAGRQTLTENERHYRDLVDDSRGLICMHDLRGKLLYVNPAAAQALGYTQEEIARMNLRDVIAPAVRHEVDGYLRRVASLRRDRGLMRILTKTGEEHIWKYDNACHEEAGGKSYVLGHAQDVTELQLTRVALEKAHAAVDEVQMHDPLTGACRRQIFLEHVGKGIERAKRHGQTFAILLLDLDEFKNINETFGRDIGDKLLQQATEVVKQSLRESDVVGRMEGDRFAIMLDDIGQVEHASLVAKKLNERLCHPWLVDGHEIVVTGSIGSACYPADGKDADALMKAAADAVDVAKRRARALARQVRA